MASRDSRPMSVKPLAASHWRRAAAREAKRATRGKAIARYAPRKFGWDSVANGLTAPSKEAVRTQGMGSHPSSCSVA